jgi:hypothetical protein
MFDWLKLSSDHLDAVGIDHIHERAAQAGSLRYI